jgi:hypothetical protein
MPVNKPVQLTAIQRRTLQALADGLVMTVDRTGMPCMCCESVTPQTRDFLVEHRLIARLDKTKPVETSGNGFTITPKGRRLLTESG